MSVATATLAVNVLDPHSLLSTFGAADVGVVLFADIGLLIGFFLPGDSSLFTAGVLAAAAAGAGLHLPLEWVLLAAIIGARAGTQSGYLVGQRVGPALFDAPGRPRRRQGRGRAETYPARYGYGRAIVLARFVPVVRTVLNPLAGIVAVPPRVFDCWQIAGGLVWSVGVTLSGYWLGSSIHDVDHYLLPIIAVIVVISLILILIPIAVAVEILRSRRPGLEAG